MKTSQDSTRGDHKQTGRETVADGLNQQPGDDARLGLGVSRDDYAEILHGLNNVLVSMLLNAQVIEWKLPSYSRMRRNLHEIERNAQRGGELVKRLLKRLEASCGAGESVVVVAENASLPAPRFFGVEMPEPGAVARDGEPAPEAILGAAPVFRANRKKVPHTMV